MQAATQKAKILAYCEEHGSITVLDAFEKLYINSPTKRISELKKAGWDVQTTIETRVNSAGEAVTFKRYYIKGKRANEQ